MTYQIVYASNGAAIGDGWKQVRVSGNGTKFEIMTDTKTGRMVEVVLKPADAAPAGDFSSDFNDDFR